MVSRIRTGDTVVLRRGKDRGKRGKVLRVFPRVGRVLVEGLNLATKHLRAKRQGEKGQIVKRPAPLALPSVMLVCPACNRPTRIKRLRQGGVASRVCKRCQATIGG